VNKFNYVTGYLPDDVQESRKKYVKKTRHISKRIIYAITFLSVATFAILFAFFTGNSISATSKPKLIKETKIKTVDQPIWSSINMGENDKKNFKVKVTENTSQNLYDDDLENLYNKDLERLFNK